MPSSVDKLEAQLQRLADARPDDVGQKMLLNTLRSLLPALRKMRFIPDDPAELDVILLAGAHWMLDMRSDDAELPEHALLPAAANEPVEATQ